MQPLGLISPFQIVRYWPIVLISLKGHNATKKDRPMHQENLTTDTDRHGDQFPPSRPGPMMFLIATVVIIAGAVIANSAAVSNFINFPQIKIAFGL